MTYRGHVMDERRFVPLDTSTPLMARRDGTADTGGTFDWTGDQTGRSDMWRFAHVERAMLEGRAPPLDDSLEAEVGAPPFEVSSIRDQSTYARPYPQSEWEQWQRDVPGGAAGATRALEHSTYRVGDGERTYRVPSPKVLGRTYDYPAARPGAGGPYADRTYDLPDRPYAGGPSDRTYVRGPAPDATYAVDGADATYSLGPREAGAAGVTFTRGAPNDLTYLQSDRDDASLSSEMEELAQRLAAAEDGGDEAAGAEERVKVEAVVDGPLPHHTFVPSWVFMARKQYPAVFEHAVDFYFANMRWPRFHELPKWFAQVCWTTQVTPDKYERTSGFAPVWVYVLKSLCDEDMLERHWFTACVSSFFEDGAFPDMEAFPDELENHCAELGIEENNFYANEP